MVGEIRIDIKPLSVNEAWKGHRFSTDKYKKYQKIVKLLLPNIDVPLSPLCIYIEFGFSSKLSDIDNPCKNFIDCLVKKYGFDDRDVYKLILEKKIVKKGEEYIKFKIESL